MNTSRRPSGFFHPGEPSEAQAGVDGVATIQLELTGPAEFKMLTRLAYQDAHFDEPFIVPLDPAGFRTDLTSVPPVFQWLVPAIGVHLPAALIHDGLVLDSGEPVSHIGPKVTREQADRIFRDGMRDGGTPLIRRWLIWTAVAVATAWAATTLRVRWRAAVVLTVGVVTMLGVAATLNLFGVWHIVPWMGNRSVAVQLLLGAAFAVMVPVVLCLLWGRMLRAGLILGWALAFLLHVTAVVALVLGAYLVLERVASLFDHRSPSIRKNLGVAPHSATTSAGD